ncbi:MAG TPA: alpha-1,4-glucan--maltose-1-phosphate maltosyltransferase [Candidatus Acidoferrales bacterium]|nr:alpha-1,4-glucan--maltose-1-phosphate maltosyltransferase [Candidatus Acidoferrales bacterium]
MGVATVPRLALREPIVIQNVEPELDCGRYPVKRELGDWLDVRADIFREGHDLLSAAVLYRSPQSDKWGESPLVLAANDRWEGSFPLDRIGRWHYTFESWTDRFGSWASDTRKKYQAGHDVKLELDEGKMLIETTLERIGTSAERALLTGLLRSTDVERLLSAQVAAVMQRYPDRSRAARYDRELTVIVDRERARFAAWYELFPRSQSLQPGVHGTFSDVERRIPEIAQLGFDVLYLPPIHPIGRTHRKGRNNTPDAGDGEVGSPWAIGAKEGGHTAIHPALGTLGDFRRLVRTARANGMELALDYALQCSPDHPWISEHPEWFAFRPDGSIRHAENPPKKYQDIVNFNFESSDAQGLWDALRDVLFFWIEQGVKIFRVDNPHTKPVPFWEWVIAQVQRRDPEVLFLAEAFTRPKMMWELAKVGFTQSYTYFTWRTTKEELTAYALELARETNDFLRPNFFANTPDILHRFLQTGGRPAFLIRLVLAATLSSLYGIYSGYELLESEAAGDSEEYLNSEKYEIRTRNWFAPGNITDDIRRINALRRANPALHEFENIRFFPSNDDSVIFYGKVDFHQRNLVFVAVNLDPKSPRAPALEFPTGEFDIDPDSLEDALYGTQLRWSYGRAYTVLDPEHNPAAIFTVHR